MKKYEEMRHKMHTKVEQALSTELHATCEREHKVKVTQGEGSQSCPQSTQSTRFKPTSCTVAVAHGPLRPHLNPQHHLTNGRTALKKNKSMLVQRNEAHMRFTLMDMVT